MHTIELKLEELIQMRTDATPTKEGVIITPLTEKQLNALNSQIRRREKENITETK